MGKPTYYLRCNDYFTQKEYEDTKLRYIKMGFRVVSFWDGENETDIQKGIQEVIKNHLEDEL